MFNLGINTFVVYLKTNRLLLERSPIRVNRCRRKPSNIHIQLSTVWVQLFELDPAKVNTHPTRQSSTQPWISSGCMTIIYDI
jgi:hypothetical protein